MSYRNSSRSSYKRTGSAPSYKPGRAVRKAVNNRPDMPDTPAPVNIDHYKTEVTTIEDISKKYGFDYSREYAEQQAEIIGRSKRDQVASERERLEYTTEQAQEDIKHDYFQDFRTQAQQLVDTGMNAGIAAENRFQLERERQNDVADVLAEEQLKQQDLDRRLSTIAREEAMYADQLYNERLQQGFDNAMDFTRFQQQENQFQLDMRMRQRNQLSNERWREFEFNNMSAAERARLAQTESQFGAEMAWREYEFNNMSEYERRKLQQDAETHGMEMAWRRYRMEAGMAAEAGSAGGAGNFSQYRKTSSYGTRTDPITGKQAGHSGNDYATPMGTPIAATAGGRVIASGDSGSGWGNYVVVQDSQGYAHIYAHLSNPGVSVGSTIRPGQVIGASGNSGRSTGPHLHYEVRNGGLGGSPVNPNRWI